MTNTAARHRKNNWADLSVLPTIFLRASSYRLQITNGAINDASQP